GDVYKRQDMAFDEWRKIFTVDVDGAFLCSQIAARQMVKQGQGGRIINITSVHEHTPLPDASAYTCLLYTSDAADEARSVD
ncbi:SDR family NAD(P)-dependent oxidoreductase, partial [Klebsiella pneumoniae]|nr:SDR family NAD(P)-dependent oxidoreductase [Klebsiella pneumoniae]